jgi:hypothetical protein
MPQLAIRMDGVTEMSPAPVMAARSRAATTPGMIGDEPVVVVDWYRVSNYAQGA